MLSLNRVTFLFLYLLLLSPLLSYISLSLYGMMPITYYSGLFVTLYGAVFMAIRNKSIKMPLFIVFALLWGIYMVAYELIIRGTLVFASFRNHFTVFFLLIIIYNTKFSKRFILNTIFIFKITVILSAIVSIIQLFNSDFLNAWKFWLPDTSQGLIEGDIYTNRRTSIFGFINPNAFGLSYIPLLSVLTGLLLYKRDRFYLVFLILGGISAFLTNARYVMIAFVLITIQIIIAQRIKIKGVIRYLIIITVTGVLLFSAMQKLGYNIPDWYKKRLFAEEEITQTTRFKAIYTFIYFFPQKPLFGFGGMTDEIQSASLSVNSSQIHVGYFSALVYYGIVGCFFLFGFWYLLAKKLHKTARHTNYWGSYFAFLTFLWANVTLVYFSIFFYGLIFAFVFDKYLLDRHKEFVIKTS